MSEPREYKPRLRCKHVKPDGQRCKGAAKEEWGGRCNIHHAIKTGAALPQHAKRKKIRDTSVPVMLRRFGMPAKDVAQLRRAFPDLDATIIGNGSVDSVMQILFKVLVMKSIAAPRPETLNAILTVATFLKTTDASTDGSVELDGLSDAGDGTWATPPGLGL